MEKHEKRLVLDVPEDIHSQFKSIVASKKTSMKAVLRDLIERYIKEHQKETR